MIDYVTRINLPGAPVAPQVETEDAPELRAKRQRPSLLSAYVG